MEHELGGVWQIPEEIKALREESGKSAPEREAVTQISPVQKVPTEIESPKNRFQSVPTIGPREGPKFMASPEWDVKEAVQLTKERNAAREILFTGTSRDATERAFYTYCEKSAGLANMETLDASEEEAAMYRQVAEMSGELSQEEMETVVKAAEMVVKKLNEEAKPEGRKAVALEGVSDHFDLVSKANVTYKKPE